MAIQDDFSVDASGNIRQGVAFVPGTHARYTTLALHAWLQDLADDAAPSSDDLVSILDANPSELAGKRNASRPMALTLLPNFNINDATAQWFKFGSVEQASGNDLFEIELLAQPGYKRVDGGSGAGSHLLGIKLNDIALFIYSRQLDIDRANICAYVVTHCSAFNCSKKRTFLKEHRSPSMRQGRAG